MANPYQAWEQAQERHITQVRGVVWTLREASRIATVPGEDQNGFSKRAVEEGKRAFFQAVDSIKFGKDASAAHKLNGVVAAVKVEDDEDVEMQIWPVGTRRDATAAPFDNTVLEIGGEHVQNNRCHINDVDCDKSVSKTTHYTTKPDSTMSNGGTTVTSGGISSNIAQTRSHDFFAMQKLPELADLVSSHEPQISSSTSGLFIEDGSCVDYPRTRVVQVATFSPNKALAIEATIDRPGILQTIEAMEKRPAAHKATAQAGGFRDHGHFADVWNADAGEVFAGLAKPIMVRPVSGKAAPSSKRKRSDGEAAGKGQKHRGAMQTETAATSSGRDISSRGVTMELLSTSSGLTAPTKRTPELGPQKISNDDLNKACADFRRDMWNCGTMDELIYWLSTIKSQSIDYYNAAIGSAEEICQMQSKLAPSEPFPDYDVLRDALESSRDCDCDLQITYAWTDWQDSLVAGPTSTTVCTTEICKPDVRKLNVRKPDVRKPKVWATEVCTTEVCKPEVRKLKLWTPQVSAPDVFAPDVLAPDVCLTEVCTTESEVCRYY